MSSRLVLSVAAAACLLVVAPTATPAAAVELPAGVAGAGTELPTEPAGEFAPATAASGLSLTVTGGQGRVVAGRDTRYEIEVFNGGEESVSVTVRASVPLRMAEVTPADGGEVRHGSIHWTVPVAAGTAEVVRVDGRFTDPEPVDRDGTVRVAFTACAIDAADDQPVICATDIAELAATSSLRRWIMGAVLAAVVVAAAAVSVWWSRRRRNSQRQPAAGPVESDRVVEPST